MTTPTREPRNRPGPPRLGERSGMITAVNGPAAEETPRERALRWARWAAPDVAVGLVVLALGLLELARSPIVVEQTRGDVYYVVVGFALAAGLSRRAPAAALGVVWVSAGMQVLAAVPLLLVELAAGVVAFGCARWGRHATVVTSGVAIPVGMTVAVAAMASGVYDPFGQRTSQPFFQLLVVVPDLGLLGVLLVATVLPLGAPWLAGLALRFLARARSSQASQAEAEAEAAQAETARAQAQELASLRESQARLASDVHDVVGHSLAVILAQAEAGQYLPDDSRQLKATLATIAGSARDSLRDVRGVLASTKEAGARATTRPAALDELLAGVRRSGHQVVSHEVGDPRPLAPDLAEVAYRVLQEMLTNAMRHGLRHHPIEVERHWGVDDLRLEVVNAVAADTSPEDPWDEPTTRRLPDDPERDRRGVVGMRRRLESVGGRLDTRLRAESFTATAWVPVRR